MPLAASLYRWATSIEALYNYETHCQGRWGAEGGGGIEVEGGLVIPFTEILKSQFLSVAVEWLVFCCATVVKLQVYCLHPHDALNDEAEMYPFCILVFVVNNNNNAYLERLSRTGPKRLHVLY